MRRRTWILTATCLLAAAGAWMFWPHGKLLAPGAGGAATGGSAAASHGGGGVAATSAAKSGTLNTNKFAYRLANTTNSIRQLESRPHAILLANAFIDTDKPLDLRIPPQLKAKGDPGAYIVQARGAVDASFRLALAAAGARIVSYIPNNAYLVRVTAGGAGRLSANAQVQAVLPYEPYYKVQSSLLGLAVDQQALPPGVALNLGLFAADAAATESQLAALGAKIIGRDRSAFGPVLRVLAPADWTALARVPGVQILEPAHARVPANDLSRVTVGVSADTLTPTNYLNLYGKNVLVAVADTGVDKTHPDLAGRVSGLNAIDLVDTLGHGTHVAGIIGSSGIHSTNPVDVGAFAEGSIPGADFRGKAPLVNLFSMETYYSDYTLQTTAALTNALISNNSWDYGNGAAEYDLAAASYDAATRDAVPGMTGSQPVLFVFAAGNSGGGDNDGSQGSGDTILSPGTAKNVITVGALEQLRNITKIVTDANSNTSAYWQPQTDSGSQVAFYSSRGNVGIGTEGNYGRFKPDVVSPGTFVVSTRSSQWDTKAYYNATNVQTTPYPGQIVDTNALNYYNVAVPPNAVAVNISITTNRFSPSPFPNLVIYCQQSKFPDPINAPGSIDITTSNNMVSIPPDSGGNITGIPAIQGNGFNFAVGDSRSFPVNYDLTVQVFTTNNVGNREAVLEQMNETLAPYYRYESGTSMAAADVSGVLALIEDYFTNQFQPALVPSPALLKALLINGCRSVGNYGIAVTNGINFQGWGLDNIQNSVPLDGLTSQFNTAGSSFFVDQSPANALATGDSHTYIVTLDTNSFSQYLPLQATLVWTDPPGDPIAAIKLVNNLDLIITNLDTGDVNYGSVYVGNDISPDIGYNLPWDTNGPPNLDAINNVENVLLAPQLGGRYSVTVVGRAVNVNAVTAQTNNAAGAYAPNIVQDYALVISVGEGEVTNAFTVTDSGIASNPTSDQDLTVVTSTNAPLFNQFVGANSPLLGTNNLPLGTNTIWGPNGVVTLGMTNQWHFYIVTNNGPQADYTNAAFILFNSYDLSIPRMGVYETSVANATRPEADIDLYVTQDPSLTNLNPVAISNCLAGANNSRSSLGQGGTEFAFYTNSAPGQIYYVGVKSEDQMASIYAFLPVFTSTPFSALQPNGDQIVNGLLLPTYIPDGDNAHPGVTNIFALAVIPMVVEKVTVTNLDEHQNFGDLFGALTFGGQSVVLNNHDGFGNTYGTLPRAYDDSRNYVPGTTNSDGPGSLVDFRAKSALGPWILSVMDNSLTMIGQVSTFNLIIQPHRNLKFPGVIVSVPPGGWFIDYVDVPAGYTNLTFAATNVTVPVATPPIQMYEKLGNDPTLTDYDQEATLTNGTPPGNTISIGPPLPMGRYFIGLYNPNTTTAQNVFLSATLGIDTSASDIYDYMASSGQSLLDEAVTPVPPFPSATVSGSTIAVPDTVTQQVASVNVGLVVQSPRLSDYTFTLVSPTGQRVLLMENRGGGTTNGAGAVFVYTNILNSTATGGAAANTNSLVVPPTGITVPITYNFYTVPDEMTVYQGTNTATFYPGSPDLLYDTGFTNNPPAGGGGAQSTIPVTITVTPGSGFTNITIIMNQFGNPYAAGGDAWIYTAGAPNTNYQYLVFTDDTNLTTVPIKFAEPPYNFTEDATNYTLSDFNLATSGDYLAPTNIHDAYGGWNMPTNLVTYPIILTNTAGANYQLVTVTNVVNLTNNLVSVISDPSTSLTGDANGSNVLALAGGTITRSIATVPGRIYNVTFWYRGPGIEGWWRGEGNASDSSDPENNDNNGTLIGRFNFPAGEVGQAFQFEDPGNTFQFAATNTYVQAPASASLNVGAGGGFTVEGWISPTNLLRPQPLVEWLARVPTNTAVTNIVIAQGPVLNPATGHYYYLLGATNWATSELWAQQLGGHLVTIDTANEENWVYDTFTAYGALNRDLWTGLTNNGLNTPFVWANGSTNVAYTNWMPGQPFDCGGNNDEHYVAIMGPTNALPGLWKLEDNLGRTCDAPPTNQIFGVVEVSDIPTNGVQFWISGTNNTPGVTNDLQGCLYANIVDTNYVSHEIFSAPGLLTTNVYQHVALTYNTNTGVAALYLNGTNVATTNFGAPFMPKTDGDLLLGWDMSRYTNNYYGGRMDEMSVYSRALSLAEISAIYHVSADTTNRLIGKFDPSVTPAVGLAEALVTFGANSNVIFGVNKKWEVNSFTFTATSNSIPLQITGLEPGILLDGFAVSEAPVTNLYYLPEEALAAVNGDTAAGNWTLQVWDNRAGAYVPNVDQLVNWQLSFVLVSNAVVSASLPPQTPVTTTVSSGQIVYYLVTVPEWAHFATNILVSSSLPVDLLFNPTNPPTGSNPGDVTMLANSTSGRGLPALTVNAALPLQAAQAGRSYYLGVRNSGAHAAKVTLEVDYDITALTSGVPFPNVLNTNEYNSVRYFEYDVSSNAYEATFQLLNLSGNADLVIRKGAPLPTLTSSDYGSFDVGNLDETIYVLTNSSPVPLSPGRWYLGVWKRDSGQITNTVLVKELDVTNATPHIIDLTNGVPFTWTAGPGAALTNFFHFAVTNMIVNGVTNHGLRFELYNLSGDGDLTVQTNAWPLSPPFFQTSQNPGRSIELVIVQTNSVLTNLVADWYLGVPNKETHLINYTVIAVMETNLYFPAFSDAQGAGEGAIGGRFGSVYHVTTNGDAGPGTLRAAVNATNRTVVFDISGAINLLSPLIITNSYLTIAGQTAPGGGITVAGQMTTVQSAHDVIIRDVRFRPGTVAANVAPIWSNGFEGGVDYGAPVGSHFAGGWLVDFGSVDNSDSINFVHDAYEGADFLDLDGSTPGGISTNIATTAGQSYQLRFVYSRNPDGPGSGFPNPPSMQVLVNGNLLSTVIANFTNSDVNLNWHPISYVFTATSPSTHLAFHSTDPSGDAYGVLLDAISLTKYSGATVDTGDSLQFLNASNVIADHISASWSANNLLSVLNSSNVTVQWSIMADSLYDTNNPHGIGSLLREADGALSFHHNLYADNYSGSPRLGDNLTLDFVNNVIYNWGIRSGLTGGTNDFDYSSNGCTNQLNYVCNYLIAGPDTALNGTNYAITNIAFFGGVTNALAANWIFQTNNFIDSDTNGILNGADTGWKMFTNDYTRFGRAFPTPPVPVDEAFLAYERVLDFAGVSLTQRDPVDTNIVTKVRYQTGRIIAAPGSLPALANASPFLDTDQDGIPDFWEFTFGADRFTPSNNNDRDGDGYTDLEEYNDWLAVPHALTITNTPVGVDLYQLCGESGHLAFSVANSIHGQVYLTNVLNFTNVLGAVSAVTNTTYFSNSFAIFTPTNSSAGGTNYYGYASFDLYVTNLDTSAYFGPVPVSVVVSAISIATNPPLNIINLTNGVPYDPYITNGSQTYHITVPPNAYSAVFELDDRTGPMALVVRYGLPPPSLSSYDYYTNVPVPPPNEQIVVLTNSSPVALAPGDWYMAAVNVNPAGEVYYTAKITWLAANFGPPQFTYPTNTSLFTNIETTPFTVTCTAVDTNTPPQPLTFALVNAPTNMTIGLSSGVINWTPTEAQGPSTNLIYVSVFNGSFSVTNNFTIIVEESNLPPVLPVIPNQLAAVPGTLVVTNTAHDPDIPANLLTYRLVNTPANAAIGTNGIITWTPTLAQAGSNYLFTTVVTDTNPWAVNAQSLSATNYFYVTVLPLLPPGQPQTNTVPPGGIFWFAVNVPTNAIAATNRLLFATNLPVNVWFSTNLPPTITNAADFLMLANATNGAYVLYTNPAAPAFIVPGGTYEVGVQNPNAVAVAFGFEVTFDLILPYGTAPYATTMPATRVTGSSAQLNGMATANGEDATAWFEWGTSPAYAYTTPPVNVGTNFNVIYLTNQITGLLTNTAFHFRLVVSNLLGVTYGYDQVLAQGSVVAWGADFFGQTTPIPPGLTNLVAGVGAGFDFSLALNYDGTVVAWGNNLQGQTNVPAGLTNAVAVAGGYSHSLALRSDRTVTVWGDDTDGQTNVPPNLTNAVAAACGGYHCLALRDNGIPVAWGRGASGQTNIPPGLSNVVAVAAGYSHSLALKNDGTVVAWGNDAQGETDVPAGLTKVVAIAAGYYDSLALKSDGTVVAWGYDANGQTSVPASLTNVTAIAAGGYHCLALKGDGSVWFWGDSSSGQLNFYPTNLINVFAIAGGGLHTVSAVAPYGLNVTNTPPYWANGLNGTTVTMGELTITNVNNAALDSNSPPQLVFYSLLNPPSYASIDSFSGVITLRPLEMDGPGTNVIITVATDNGYPPLSATNSFTVVVTNLTPPPTITVSGIIYTNIAGTNGFLLTWFAPSNDLFQVQWTGGLAPASWNTFSNIVSYNTNAFTSPANTQFNFFDDGTQTGGFGPARFYRLILLGSVQTTNPPPVLPLQTNRVINPLNPLVVTNTATDAAVPAPTLTYTLASSVTGTNQPAINPTNGVITWTPTLAQSGTSNVLTTIVTASGVPSLSATNSFAVIVNPVPTLGSVIATNGGFLLTWYAPTNDIFQVQFTDSLSPVNWQSFSNIITYTGPVTPTNGLFTFFDDGSQYPFTGLRFYHLILLGLASPVSTNPPPMLPVQTNRVINPLSPLVVTNTATDTAVPAPTLTYTLSSSVTGTNQPAINPINGVITWTPTLAQSGTSNTLTTVVTASGVPSLSATNSFAVIVNPLPALGSVIATNGGFLLTWYAPTNDIFQVQFTDNLSPVNWQSFSNIITYTGPVTPTNGLFTFFDDGSQYPFTGLRFYHLVLLGLASPVSTNPPPVLPVQTNRVINPLSPLVVTNTATDAAVPAPTLTYTLSSSVTGTNLPTISTNGIITWTPTLAQSGTSNTLTTVVTASGVPSLSATNTFAVVVNPVPALGSVIATNGGFLLTWYAPTNDIFQVQFTDSLSPVNWQSFSNIITYTGPVTPTNGLFTFFDDGSQYPFTGLRFYHLILLGLASPVSTNPPPVLPVQTNHVINPLSPLVVTNTATDAAVPAPTLTYTLASSVTGTNLPTISTNGIITWTPTLAQSGTSNVLTTIVTASGVPSLSATNSFAVIVNPVPTLGSVIATNGGFLLTWYAPTNDRFQVQWTASLVPVNWQTFSNIITYTGPVTPTNGLFTFFDDGSQTGGFGQAHFYKLNLLGPIAGTLALPSQSNRVVSVSAAVTVTNAATAAGNAVLTYSLVNPPAGASINPTNGIILWTASPAGLAARFTTLVADNSLPPLTASNRFTIFVTPFPAITNVMVTATNVVLRWTAPTNDVFQVQWTTNLVPVVNWLTFPNLITSSSGLFTFTDTNAPLLMKFYELILLP